MTPPPSKLLVPAEATEHIRAKARSDAFHLIYTDHASDRMSERDLIAGDVIHVLKYGTIYGEGEPATRNQFRYLMECTTPNSNGRTVGVVVIPMPDCAVKIVTVMWRDETNRQIGE